MARKTKRDWWIAGIQILTETGPSGLTIDNLCQQLEVTKGSFYHHFGGIEDFKERLLAYYEAEGTLDIIERLTAVPTPEGKFKGLIDIIVEPRDAKIKAQLTYAVLVGAEQMQPPIVGDDLRALYDEFLPLIGIE